MAPVGPAASSRARNTVSWTLRLPSSVSGDSARQRRTKSRISGIHEGRAGNVWDSTTTGTTSIGSSPCSLASSATISSGSSGRPDRKPPGLPTGYASRRDRAVTVGHFRQFPIRLVTAWPTGRLPHCRWLAGRAGLAGESPGRQPPGVRPHVCP